jgi:primosomal protein N' (replication factor Y)
MMKPPASSEAAPLYADLYVDFPLNMRLTYSIPPGMEAVPGKRVRVNLGGSAGRTGRVCTGFIAAVHSVTPDGGYEIKPLTELVDVEPVFDERLVSLALDISSYYASTPEEALSMALPSALKEPKKPSSAAGKTEAGIINILTDEQRSAYESIMSHCGEGSLLHLVHGITGSGKTDLYITLAEEFIRRGKSVIYLVPEISLTSHIRERLERAFGNALVTYHSGMSAGERLRSWKKFYSGEAKIAVGTRSSVFMQCPDPGLIIIDEEHDGSFKENSSPRYNARRVAFMRSSREGAAVVLGSATPSIESYYAAEQGVLKLHRLTKRFAGASLPQIEIAKIERGGVDNMLSSQLRLHSMRAFRDKKQAVFLLNRRGFAPFVSCGGCGWVAECGACGIPFNYHRGGTLVCHYCGQQQPSPAECPECGSEKILRLGAGTQKIEELVVKAFAGCRVSRLDRDATNKKGCIEDIVEGMNCGDIDILLGTQLVAKGFDFKNVTVVGVLSADIGLYMPDFRSSERVFSLLMQAAGRAGRGGFPGRVIVQTFDPENSIFRFLVNHDYEGFYKFELETRRALGYPPFMRLVRLLVRGTDRDKVRARADELKELIAAEVSALGISVRMLGPAAAPIEKIGGSYRHHIILKAEKIPPLMKAISSIKGGTRSGTYLEIDVDPFDIM